MIHTPPCNMGDSGHPYQWHPLDSRQVLQQALGMEDGGMQVRVRPLPLAVQVLPTERTPVAGGD